MNRRDFLKPSVLEVKPADDLWMHIGPVPDSMFKPRWLYIGPLDPDYMKEVAQALKEYGQESGEVNEP